MSTKSPDDDPRGRVIPFRRPGSLFKRPAAPPPSPVKGLSEFERKEPETAEDYRQRMLVNGLGALMALLLIAGGWWIADSMARQRKDQDCVLAGRKTCATLDVTSR